MYAPKHFDETSLEAMFQLIQSYPLGALVTVDQDGINANHIPFEILAPTQEAPFGTLRAHVARANSVWKNPDHQQEVLAIFQGPQAYITPTWYEEKKLSGKVVPTYNYAVVHGYGKLRVIDDTKWLQAHLERLSDQQETTQTRPWKISDAPDVYIQKMLSAIVGIEIPLAKLQGKWKVSQNKSEQDRVNIAAGLRLSQNQHAHDMAVLVETRQENQAIV
ncbi:FMN-binding negative transcriptional regulator [Undibacterium sp. Di24W]|uniref:FMN-binding negative transcriptional regulator n=1 Tax=Undibacterium sp. Di24W TaxID=3413033 RepID=UPI003BF2A8FA